MRDLELRGAGSLLGDEQSGHVAALGFELYMQMLDEAVQAMASDDGSEYPEPVRLDVNVDAYVPADYIPYEQAKVDVHRRIAGAREISELMELRRELDDRFGELPEPLDKLALLRCAMAGEEVASGSVHVDNISPCLFGGLVLTVGIDAINLDETPDDDHPGDGYPCHHLVASAGGIIAENLTDLAEVEGLVDPLVCLFPVRLAGADGAPVRAVAMQLQGP